MPKHDWPSKLERQLATKYTLDQKNNIDVPSQDVKKKGRISGEVLFKDRRQGRATLEAKRCEN